MLTDSAISEDGNVIKQDLTSEYSKDRTVEIQHMWNVNTTGIPVRG
jgi:hypothetical protein